VIWIDIAVFAAGLMIGVAGAVWTIVSTAGIKTRMKNVRLAIETGDGRLVDMINIEAIDREDPERLERALHEVERAKREPRRRPSRIPAE
jgi:hypothetical protein